MMEEARVRNYALRLLKYRPRTKKEILDRLKKKNFPSELIEKTVQDLTEAGLINDREFVKFWINWRKEVNPRGKNFIFWELQQKGISQDLIEEGLETITSEDDFLRAEELARKKYESLKRFLPLKAKRRLYAYLERRGFSRDIIFAVIEKIFSSQ